MNTNIFKTAIAALALATLTFNSCKDKEETEEEYQFHYEKVSFILEDGTVFTDIENYRDAKFYSIEGKNYSSYDIYMGTSPDSCQKTIIDDIKPFTKYYWYVVAHEPNKYDNTVQSEIRTFYYVTPPQITEIHNVEGDWAAIVKWGQSDYMKASKLTLTPDKECKYDNTPIDLSAMADSCYISAGGEFNTDNQKYTVYHQWWDDSKAQYYEPVIYGFNVIYEGEIDGHSFSVASDTAKYIFLDRAKYAADNYFNVYRMGRIGNRTWLLEDLRGIPNRYIIPTLTSPLGFKACAYSSSFYNNNESFGIIPEGFHLATDDDWQDLEYTYGVEKTDCSNYAKANIFDEMNIKMSMEWAISCGGTFLENYNKELTDTIKYVGKNKGIFKTLISEKEWITNDSLQNIIEGSNGFNARPYGTIWSGDGEASRIGTLCLFLTSTKDPNDSNRQIIRYLWSDNQGIARVSVTEAYRIRYLYRCVKDE